MAFGGSTRSRGSTGVSGNDKNATSVPQDTLTPLSPIKSKETSDVDPGFVISIINTSMIFLGLALGTVGIYFMTSADYSPPPVPAGYVLGNIILLLGAAMSLQALLSLVVVLSVEGSTPANSANTATQSFVLAWGLAFVLYAVLRFLVAHPFELTICPCPAFHAKDAGGTGCVPCPGFEEGVCDDEECVCGNGVCSETTATCLCDFNFALGDNLTCSECSDRTMDSGAGRCTRCTERFRPDPATGDCSLCRPGYVGADCKECHPNFEPRRNDDGSVFLTGEGAMVCGPVSPGCKKDQPPGGGRSGIMCEPVQNCAQWGDVNARVRATNADVALAQPATFTFNGQAACAYDHDCEESYNCRGVCSWGKGGLEGALCLENDDCGAGGVCEGRVCAVERRVGSFDCECSRSSYLAPRCEACPGFDGVWAENVCGGRGSCQARYVNVGLGWASEYEALECVCGKPLGVLTEFPRYAGDYCEKVVDENDRVQECAEGYFGDDCSITCPGGDGWGGAGVCSSRGACKYDANTKQAQCECDADTKFGGVGYYSGSTCEACAGEFYSEMCQPCPGLQVTSDCPSGSFLLSVNPVKTCFGSCSVKTCDDGKKGLGVCQ